MYSPKKKAWKFSAIYVCRTFSMVSRIEIWACIIIDHANWSNVPIGFAIDISAFAIFPKENKKKEKKKANREQR